ncbi:DNA-binding transcriptional ArsR family regulator [Agrococcus sp. UYP33]
MHALDVLGDPVRRRILELLADGEQSAGTIAATIGDEFGISQPAVSQHLRVLRERGFAVVRPEGQRRLYAVDASGPREASEWLSAFDRFWMPRLAALDTELARGRRRRRLEHDPDGGDRPVDPHPTKET